ncbi:1-phosphofructokinase family hexose kinase [Paraburkholderia sp. T12-10]|nr:1-phosphofructokinase family hexose kinase [Paraburkholderia sp. T12-10]
MVDIVTLTLNPSVDLSLSVDHVVDTVKLRCSEPRKDAGGGGVNVARVLKRLGSNCLAVYLAGGAVGACLAELLDAERVDGKCIAIEGGTRENVTVLETSTRKEYRFVMPGPTLTELEWRRCLNELEALDPAPRYVVASGSLPPGVPHDFYARVARWAHTNGVRMALDASGDALAAALDVGVFLVKPSLDELRALAHAPLAEPPQWREAAQHLVERGAARIVALSLGGRGAFFATAGHVVALPAPPVTVVSAVGAGDSFLAAIIWALDHEASHEQALRYAIAAGSAAVLRAGTALCDTADVIRLYRDSYELAPAVGG